MRQPKDRESITLRYQAFEEEVNKRLQILTVDEICQLAQKFQDRLKPRDRRTRRVNLVELAKSEIRIQLRYLNAL